ncbi:MAG TPA: ATP-binding protein [bacterium]|nr:ATP-binding protein [bacterium]
MREIPKDQIIRRLETENPWWQGKEKFPLLFKEWTPRPYLRLFLPLMMNRHVRRAVVLMGPRRVGKTVMIHHAIQHLLEKKYPPCQIIYLSVDHPLYTGLGLESLLEYYREATGLDYTQKECYVFFDEIQYLKNWEVHLKAIVDSYPSVKCMVSGSAAAALRMKSLESGAGRFTEFLLPPLTFYEYLHLLKKENLIQESQNKDGLPRFHSSRDVDSLNREFFQYLNFGGYPEAIFSEEIQADPRRFLKSDILDKVLLRDLPSLYGIQDIQELNSLFTTLAYNTAGEISLEDLSKSSGVSKNTIKKYMEYLEAAFLIRMVHRIDRDGRRFLRANTFKVYLTNPSMHCALFKPVEMDREEAGPLVETAVYAQWFHVPEYPLYYARWKRGEIDLVHQKGEKVEWAVEVKWSDRPPDDYHLLEPVIEFCHAHNLGTVLITTRRLQTRKTIKNVQFEFIPASVYCYKLGKNLIQYKQDRSP